MKQTLEKLSNEEPRPLASIEDVSAYLGIPIASLYQWRYLNKGPRAAKVGRHLRYRWADVNEWLDKQER